MDLKELQSMLTIGETVAVEFKRCGNGMESDTYESQTETCKNYSWRVG